MGNFLVIKKKYHGMKKTTLIISSYDDLKNPYFAGGGAQAVHAIAKRLVKKNYKVTVLTGKFPGCKNERIDGVLYERIGTSFLGAQLDQITFQLCLPFSLLKKPFDVWLESFTPPFSTSFLQLFTKKPVIGLVHMLSGEDMKRKYKLPFDWIENLGLKTYRYFITPSEQIAQKVRRQNTKAYITTIPNGIETMPAKLPATRGKYILFLGRIEINQKGLDLLLDAYAELTKIAGIPLHIAGSGEKKDEAVLQRMINKLSLTKQVKLLGRVSGDAKGKVYEDASFVVLPCRFETFSVVALEAMSYAKALVYFAIDGLQWIPEDAGIAVKPFDQEVLSQRMLQLLAHPEQAEQMGKQGRNYAKQHTWDKLVEIYEDCIARTL